MPLTDRLTDRQTDRKSNHLAKAEEMPLNWLARVSGQ
jgi:hypothetical protein